MVSSALTLMHEIIRARYPSGEWNIYGAQASDGDNWHQDSRPLPRAAGRQAPAAGAATSPTCRWPRKSRTCGRSTRSCADANPHFAMRKVADAQRRSTRCSATCSRKRRAADRHEHQRSPRPMTAARCAARSACPSPSRLDLRAHRAVPRRDRATAQRFGLDTYPNQLEVITAEQMMDAYASRRHAGELPPLVASASSSSPPRRATGAATWAWPTRSSSTPTPASPT